MLWMCHPALVVLHRRIYTVRQEKTARFLFSQQLCQIMPYFDIFGAQIPELLCNKTVTKFSTSRNERHYTYLMF